MVRKSEKTHSEAIGSIPFVAGLLYGPMCMSVARFYTPDDHVKPTSLSNCLTVSTLILNVLILNYLCIFKANGFHMAQCTGDVPNSHR